MPSSGPSILGSAISGGASLLGGAFSGLFNNSAVSAQNTANEAMLTQSENYNTQMSNTSWQRGVADMKAAGINPMLAVSQGGASSPTAAPPMMQAQHMPDIVSPAINTALSTYQQGLAAQSTQATLDKTKADVASTNANTTKTLAETQPASKYSAFFDAEMKNIKQQMASSAQGASSAATSQAATQYSLPGLKNQADLDSSFMGRVFNFVRNASQAVHGGSSAVQSLPSGGNKPFADDSVSKLMMP